MSTTLYSSEHNIDYAHRVAKILALRMDIPVYVGCSIQFSGLMVEEEIESFTMLMKVIMNEWDQYENA